jgi:hypothetical protein
MADAVAPSDVEASLQHLRNVAQLQGRGDELVVALLRESAELLQMRQPRGGALSDEQVAFLIESGDFTPEEFLETSARVARGELSEEERKTRLGAIAASLSATEVALRLGIDPSRVRHLQANGSLYAFIAGGRRRYPLWQFTDDPTQPVLPGLATVIKVIGDKKPASIKGFMSAPQEDLLINDERVTAPEWLLQGGDPQAVVNILDSFLQF